MSYRYDCAVCKKFRLGVPDEYDPPETIDCIHCGAEDAMERSQTVSSIGGADRREFDFDRPKRIHGLRRAYGRNMSEIHSKMEKNELFSHPGDESGIKSPLGVLPETPRENVTTGELSAERLIRQRHQDKMRTGARRR